jgi:hypothetical protein
MHVRAKLRMRVVVSELDAARRAYLQRAAALRSPRLLRLKLAADRAPAFVTAGYECDLVTSLRVRIIAAL